MADKRQRFRQRLDQLREVISSANAFHAVWSKLQLHDETEVSWSLDRQNQIIGRWKGFFTPVGIGLQRMALMEVAKVFDDDRRTVSLTNLLKQAEQDASLIPHAIPNDVSVISGRLQRAKATYRIIKKLRNQRLAHADANPEPLPPLMNQKVESLIEEIKFAFNELSRAHDRSVHAWDFPVRDSARSTTDVLGLLLKAIERREVEHDERMAEIVTGQMRRMEATLGRSLDNEEMESVVRQYALTLEQEQRVWRASGLSNAPETRRG